MGYTARVLGIITLLHGRGRLSDRDTADFMQMLFCIPMADGTVTATEQVMSTGFHQAQRLFHDAAALHTAVAMAEWRRRLPHFR